MIIIKILTKIKNVTSRLWKEIKLFPITKREFGLSATFYIIKDRVFLRPKSKKYINAIYKYTLNFLNPIVKKYSDKIFFDNITAKKLLDANPIWVLWLQGEENMPELVRTCYKSVKRNAPDGTRVYLLTNDNIDEYINISDSVKAKVRKGIMSYAFYSDIIRYTLLRDYGGMWIDSTIYVSSKISNEWVKNKYFSMKMHEYLCPHEACRGKWTNFCFSGEKGFVFFRYVCDALNYYTEWHNNIPDYVFLDYILMVGYNHIKEVKDCLDSVPYNNEYVWELKNVLEQPYDEETYRKIVSENTFHKFAHQVEYQKSTEDGKQTFYGHIVSEYDN